MTTSTSPAERAELAAIALRVAAEAAKLVDAGYRSRPRADRKGKHDLVTEFDRASQALLLDRLGALTPGIPIVAEEDPASAPDAGARERGATWYVDPLDGTTNFVHGHPVWSVAIGLLEDGEP